MPEPGRSGKSKWGLGVFALYGGFVIFVLCLVVFASVQQFGMVEPDYYQKELAYQQQIDRATRARALPTPLSVVLDNSADQLVVQFPDVRDPSEIDGTLTLFRPSNRHLDRIIQVQTDDSGGQYIATTGMARGLWRLKVNWMRNGLEYYHEELLIVE